MQKYSLSIRIITLTAAFIFVMLAMAKLQSGAVFAPNSAVSQILGIAGPTPASK